MEDRFDMVQFLKDLRAGKSVKCRDCSDGHLVPMGDPESTHCFHCDKCESQVIID